MKKVLMVMVASVTLLVACSEEVKVERGIDGNGCTVTKVEDTTVIECPDGTKAVILDGQDAVPVIEYFHACGYPLEGNEILLRLPNGQLIAFWYTERGECYDDDDSNSDDDDDGGYYDDGCFDKGFLRALKTNREYETHDGTQCYYRVNRDWSVTPLLNY